MKKKQHVQWRTPLDIPAIAKQEVFTPKYSVYLYTKYTKYSVYSVYPNQLNLTTKYCFIPKRKYIQGHKQHIYIYRTKVKVKVTRLCSTLCDPMVYTVYGILQFRILEWVAYPFSRNLPDPGSKPWSLALQADSLLSEPPGKLNNGRSHQNEKPTYCNKTVPLLVATGKACSHQWRPRATKN